MRHVGIVAGEASGDLLGAGLILSLRQSYPDLKVTGIGGPAMLAAGCTSLFALSELSVMGIIEPLKRLPRLLQIRRALYHHFSQTKPDIFIGVDAPDFNLGLAAKLRRLQGLKTAQYVSPSVWAWRQKRIHKIARSVDLMLTLLPFEAEFYERHQVPVQFVGHPLADKIPMQVDKNSARQALGLDSGERTIALLPGSRQQELAYLGKVFLEAAEICGKKKPDLRFITSSVNADRDRQWRELQQRYAPNLPLQFFTNRTQEVLAAADVVLVTSGTATLETLLFKRPMVIAYKTSAFNYFIGKCLIKTPFIGLPNILSSAPLVSELIQNNATPEKMAEDLLSYFDHPEKALQLQEQFVRIHQQLAQNADDQAAKAIIGCLTGV